MVLDTWQELVLQSAMGERSDATWATKRVGLSVPRQNGKSQLLVARALAGALLFSERKIVISAHQQDTARESFTKLLEIIEADANDWLRERIPKNGIMQALNREAVKFRNGATIQFKARSGAGGRGFSSDCLMLDEAQILSQRAWVSINSTMSAMPNPQVWLLGTPPTPEDDGAVFGSIRAAAKGGKSTATTWLEWAADPNADPASDETRWSANPAWNTRINHEVVQGEFESYPPDRFALDRLGVWLEELGAKVDVFGVGAWDAGQTDLRPKSPTAIGVAVSVDRMWASIAAASVVGDGQAARPFVAAVDRRPGVDWLVDEVKRIQDEHGCAVVIDEKGPTRDLLGDLEDADVRVEAYSLDQYAEACSRIFDKVQAGDLLHPAVPPNVVDELGQAIAGAQWRTVGDRQVWGRRKSTSDVSMLEAATLAMHAALTPSESVYESRGALVL